MMNRDPEERMLHDYLDGRLSREERRRFEERLGRDPALADRVEALREVGRALREGEEELPPGFYTRARVAFEEAARGRAGRRWFRPLSWETAGLATAVLIAAALFVPGLLRSPLQLDAWSVPEPAREEKSVTFAEPEGAPVAGHVAEDESSERQAEPEPETAPAASEADRARPAPTRANELGRGAAPKKAGPAEDRDKERAGEAASRWAPEPPPEASVDEADQLPPPAPQKEEAKTKEQRLAEAEEEYAVADAARRSLRAGEVAESAALERPAALPLPPGVVEPGALRVIDDSAEWRTLLDGPAGRTLLDLGGYDPRSRLVLIGAREEPLDCSRVSIVTTEAAHWILVSPPPDGGHAAANGCAVLVPRDGRTIEVAPGPAG